MLLEVLSAEKLGVDVGMLDVLDEIQVLSLSRIGLVLLKQLDIRVRHWLSIEIFNLRSCIGLL